MKVRGYAAKDAAALTTLSRRSIEVIGSRDYTLQQVAAWAARLAPPERIHERAADGRTTLVAVDGGDRPIGFVDLEHDGHIDFLYCTPEAAGRAVASALYDALETGARERGVGRLFAEASEAARRFFLKKRFRVTARRAFAIGGVEIHNHAVEKALSHSGVICACDRYRRAVVRACCTAPLWRHLKKGTVRCVTGSQHSRCRVGGRLAVVARLPSQGQAPSRRRQASCRSHGRRARRPPPPRTPTRRSRC